MQGGYCTKKEYSAHRLDCSYVIYINVRTTGNIGHRMDTSKTKYTKRKIKKMNIMDPNKLTNKK